MNKKIIGILVCMLMFVSTINTFQARQLKNNDDIDEQTLMTLDDEYDLSIDFINCHPDVTLVRSRYGQVLSQIFYHLDFTIENKGVNSYNGEVKLMLGHALGDLIVDFDQWTLNIDIEDGSSYIGYKSWEVYNVAEPNLDLEKQFAGKYLTLGLELLQGDDTYPENNIDYGRAEHWHDIWNPTKTQTEVNIPHSYRTIPVGRSLYYFDLPFDISDFDDYPTILLSRMGWTLEFATYFTTIIADISVLVQDFNDFVEEGSQYVESIFNQCKILLLHFYNLLKGEPVNIGLTDLLKNFKAEVKSAISQLLYLAREKHQEALPKVEKFNDDFEDFKKWIGQEPWKNPIKVVFDVAVKRGETINVDCRGVQDQKNDDDGDGWIHFVLEVPPLYGDEVYYWDIKDCTIKVNPSQHDPYTSQKITSWAFTNGTLKFLAPVTLKAHNKNDLTHNCAFQLVLSKILNRFPVLKTLFQIFYGYILTENFINDKNQTIPDEP